MITQCTKETAGKQVNGIKLSKIASRRKVVNGHVPELY